MGVSAVAANAAAATNQDYSSTTKKSSKNKDVSMQDFFTLLAAQLKNQNMMNPVGDTEFLSQMAQFSALSATQQLNSSFSNFMAVSYIGKNIKATQADMNGETQVIEGVAKKVEFENGETFITVNETKISVDQITEVSV